MVCYGIIIIGGIMNLEYQLEDNSCIMISSIFIHGHLEEIVTRGISLEIRREYLKETMMSSINEVPIHRTLHDSFK